MRNKKFLICLLFIIMMGSFLLTPSLSYLLANRVEIPPSLTLLGAGAKWAAKEKEGVALYVNWQDNLFLHPNPYGPIYTVPNAGDSISYILNEYGFEVKFAGEIPENLDQYSVVVITAYWAVEPKHELLIRDYLSKGGGIVIIGGVPCYFICYSKDLWPYRCGGDNLKSIQEWFGAGWYFNSGGDAKASIDNPFDTDLKKGDIVKRGASYSSASVSELQPNAEIIAEWENGEIFSFRYENLGRVYYQADYDKYEKYEMAVPKQISEMTLPELQTQISKVKREIIELMSQTIQIIQVGVIKLQTEIAELQSR
jgi:hypothetical protein